MTSVLEFYEDAPVLRYCDVEELDVLTGKREGCPKRAVYLVEHPGSTMYLILCAAHGEEYRRETGFAEIIFHPHSIELNEQFARRAREAIALERARRNLFKAIFGKEYRAGRIKN